MSEKKAISLHLPAEIYKYIKIESFESGKTMSKLVAEIILNYKKEKHFNVLQENRQNIKVENNKDAEFEEVEEEEEEIANYSSIMNR